MRISRRSLIKSAGYFSLLYFAGYASSGLCYFSPQEDDKLTQKKNIIEHNGINQKNLNSKNNLDWDCKHCVLGTSGVGFQVSNGLQASKKENGFDVFLFTPEMIGIYEYLKDQDVIFLVGSIEDQDFWIARDLVIAANPHLIVSLVTCKGIAEAVALHGSLQTNEGVILLPQRNTLPVTLKIIQDFCWSITNSPKIICLDFADIKQYFSGGVFIPLVAESNSFQAREAINTLVERNKRLIEMSETLYIILLMDHSSDNVLSKALEIGEHIYNTRLNHDSAIIISVDPPHHSDIDFRAIGFISVSPAQLKYNT